MIRRETFKYSLETNLIEKCAPTYKDSETVNRDRVRHQIRRDLQGLNLTFNNQLLNPERLHLKINKETPALQHLTLPDDLALRIQEASIEKETSWEILASFQQAIERDLFEIAKNLFSNRG